MMGIIEQLLMWILLPLVGTFLLTPTFGSIPITTIVLILLIWYIIVGAIQGVGVGAIVLAVLVLVAGGVATLGNLTPGVNTTLATVGIPWVIFTWLVARSISGQWPDYFLGTTYMVVLLTAFIPAVLTPILGPTIGFVLTAPSFIPATAGFPLLASPTFTTLASSIYLSSLIPVVGPTTAIVPYLALWIVGIVAGVIGFFGTAVAGLIIAPIGFITGLVPTLISLIITNLPVITIAILVWIGVLSATLFATSSVTAITQTPATSILLALTPSFVLETLTVAFAGLGLSTFGVTPTTSAPTVLSIGLTFAVAMLYLLLALGIPWITEYYSVGSGIGVTISLPIILALTITALILDVAIPALLPSVPLQITTIYLLFISTIVIGGILGAAVPVIIGEVPWYLDFALPAFIAPTFNLTPGFNTTFFTSALPILCLGQLFFRHVISGNLWDISRGGSLALSTYIPASIAATITPFVPPTIAIPLLIIPILWMLSGIPLPTLSFASPTMMPSITLALAGLFIPGLAPTVGGVWLIPLITIIGAAISYVILSQPFAMSLESVYFPSVVMVLTTLAGISTLLPIITTGLATVVIVLMSLWGLLSYSSMTTLAAPTLTMFATIAILFLITNTIAWIPITTTSITTLLAAGVTLSPVFSTTSSLITSSPSFTTLSTISPPTATTLLSTIVSIMGVPITTLIILITSVGTFFASLLLSANVPVTVAILSALSVLMVLVTSYLAVISIPVSLASSTVIPITTSLIASIMLPTSTALSFLSLFLISAAPSLTTLVVVLLLVITFLGLFSILSPTLTTINTISLSTLSTLSTLLTTFSPTITTLWPTMTTFSPTITSLLSTIPTSLSLSVLTIPTVSSILFILSPTITTTLLALLPTLSTLSSLLPTLSIPMLTTMLYSLLPTFTNTLFSLLPTLLIPTLVTALIPTLTTGFSLLLSTLSIPTLTTTLSPLLSTFSIPTITTTLSTLLPILFIPTLTTTLSTLLPTLSIPTLTTTLSTLLPTLLTPTLTTTLSTLLPTLSIPTITTTLSIPILTLLTPTLTTTLSTLLPTLSIPTLTNTLSNLLPTLSILTPTTTTLLTTLIPIAILMMMSGGLGTQPAAPPVEPPVEQPAPVDPNLMYSIYAYQ